MMTTQVQTQAAVQTSPLAAITVVFLAGAALLFAAGFAQATVLHDAAHDTRHAMAFPCH
ncbi:MAG TPA: cobalt transporter subunit cbtB-like protein [Maritimibacter sp.]|nr:cobalt transporter subunit cbtB-like protein [Maritimibacter sp.]